MQVFTRQSIQFNSSHSTEGMGLDFIIQLLLALAGQELLHKLKRRKLLFSINIVHVSGDVESNPGPICNTAEDPVGKLQDIVEVQGDKVIDMKEAVDKQNKAMEEMLITINEMSTKMDEINAENDKHSEEITEVSKIVEEENKSNIKVFEKLTEEDSKIDEELEQQKVTNHLNLNHTSIH